MTHIRVSPNLANGTRARLILAKWASRHTQRNSLSSTKATNPDVLIERAHERQVASREKVFEQHLPFSWLRFFVGLVSLALVFSDIPRSGTGISKLDDIYPSLQPEEMLAFGTSWNYSVFASTKAEASSGRTTARVWSYKFDSTSIVWRAFGRFLTVVDFPECFFYSRQCPNKTFTGTAAFKMIDSLVNSVASLRNSSQEITTGHVGPVGLTLRSENEFIDRFHQFLLPKWFTSINWRLNQALHYSPEFLTKMDVHSICFPAKGKYVRAPRFCQELWVNFQRAAAPSDLKRRSVGLLYVHTMQRLRDVQARFPNFTMDLTVLESQEDLQICRGGLGSVGYRRSDVSTIIRARDCSGRGDYDTCETMYVSDYRYEAGFLVTDVIDWYRLVATLRVVGQSYFILRGLGLMLSCYFVHNGLKSHNQMSKWTRVHKAWRLFMRVPKQCVVYGSPLPVLCYVLAHLLDASFMYEVFKSRYSTQDGILNIQFRSFVSYAVLQMRTVWVYALIWQTVVALSTPSWQTRNYQTRSDGVIGVPAFFLSTLSSLTLAAQYRSTSFRSSRILQLMEFPSNVGRAWGAARYQYGFAHRGRGNLSFGGVLIDLKFLICFMIVLAVAWAVRSAVFYCWSLRQRSGKPRHLHWFILAPTPVPYSAGALWPTTSVCVHWLRSIFCIQRLRQRRRQQPQEKELHFSHRFRLLRWSRFDGIVVPLASSFRSHGSSLTTSNKMRSGPAQQSVNSLRSIQHQIQCLHRRSEDVEATVAFMNTVLLSDPLVYLRIIVGTARSTQLGYYQSRWRPQQVVLLPVAVVGEHNESSAGLNLLRQVNASELTWPELVQCG
ncbi:hypothetical protein PHYPSEUDO_002101 [Phytophthora pseudosyringae]|uniref:Transmembrane protein n=1 Tax=Phytophthora pseudosyringae TaxID=221518 RepID=A0A8T1V6S4_9STRA|nr:hypothetical protein PHYPSEUDO_002101 [Phytophthora pseudosyringae]